MICTKQMFFKFVEYCVGKDNFAAQYLNLNGIHIYMYLSDQLFIQLTATTFTENIFGYSPGQGLTLHIITSTAFPSQGLPPC